jgi:hypothetical protein
MGAVIRFGLIVFAACLGGCATPYAPESEWNRGGYSELPRGPDLYQVWFVGNERTPPEKSDDLAMLRAADLCLESSLPFMRVGKFTSAPMDVRRTAAQVLTRRSRIAGLGPDNLPYYPTDLVSFRPGRLAFRTRSGLEVACLASADEETKQAAEVAAAIRQRYEIQVEPAR